MKTFVLALFVAVVFLASAEVASALTDGCVDSPENPTAVFGLLAAIASFGFARLRNRGGSRRD